MVDFITLKKESLKTRIDLLKMIKEAGTGHTGSSLSNTDILTALYYGVLKIDPANPEWEERDRYIQSKGHAVESLWVTLANKGFFPKEELKTFSKFDSRLIGHPNNKVPGVEMNTGSLGHGLSISVGMALAAKLDNKSYRVFTLMGDGELAEGSIWEAAMAAAQYKLDNLIGIIDRNHLQITGKTKDVMNIEPLDEKWKSFGWEVVQADGHNLVELVNVLNNTPIVTDKPTMVIANTVKGKGVPMAENQAGWHHHVPTDEELEIALNELTMKLEEIK